MESSGTLNILLVDDDKALCDSLAALLKEDGFTVVCVFTGAESFEAVKTCDFDAAIIDVRLPDFDGNEVLQRLRAEDPDMGILMMSGVATLVDAVKSLNLGADAFLLKPVDPEELISKIRKIARLKRLERRLKESERRYRELVENSTDGIVLVGLDWKINFANSSFLKMLGLTREEVEGRSFTNFIEPFDSTLLLNMIRGPLEKGRVSLPRFKMRYGNGVPIEVEASSSLQKRDGTPVGVQMILRDIGERQLTEDRVKDLMGISPDEYLFNHDYSRPQAGR